jgi:type VI protein secretion system component VasK
MGGLLRRSPRRTMLLGVVALGVLLWGVVTQFDVPREQVLAMLWDTLLALGVVILLAALATGVLILLRRQRRRWSRDQDS